jgi:putative addiction module killer protein
MFYSIFRAAKVEIRIYFAEIAEIIVLLLCAGDKSSQAKDIAKAQEYWNEYCSRIEKV